MARGAQKQAKDTYNAAKGVQGQGSGLFTTSQGNANGIFSPLLQSYQQEVINPQGYGPTEKAAMNTAAQQSTGGATAGAVGSGNLMAARTRNRGGFQVANNEAAREGMRRNSEASVGIEAQNAKLKEAQRQAGLAGEAGLYDENLREALGALGAENQSLGEETGATNSLTNAGNSGWFQNMLGFLNAVKPGYSSGGGFKAG